jgi:hypothetical protein
MTLPAHDCADSQFPSFAVKVLLAVVAEGFGLGKFVSMLGIHHHAALVLAVR